MLYSLLFTLMLGTRAGDPKILGGHRASSMEGLEFMAVVQFCVSGNSCYRCSGILIAPNVVLTAGHCVRNQMNPFGDGNTAAPPSAYMVTLGSTNWQLPDAGALMYSVKQIVFGGFGQNIRYPFDGDIALLELDGCVEERAGLIQYARVATWETEPSRSGCTNVTIAGYGAVSGVPRPLNDDDGQLRSITDKIHSPDVCRQAYADLMLGYTEPVVVDMQSIPDDIANTVLGENIFCTGGASRQSICHGDSGGPTFTRLENGRAQVIGVTSFGFGDGYCMFGPDWSTRVAFHTDWIKEQMTMKFSTCADYDFSTSFASDPFVPYPTDHLSSEWKTSRCAADKWQCTSGECIDLSQVCDGNQYDCADNSDEDYSYESVSLCSNTARRLDEAVRPFIRPFISLGFERVKKQEMKVDIPCTKAISDTNTAINVAKVQDTIADLYWNPTAVLAACNSFMACMNDGSEGTSAYKDAHDQCTAILSWWDRTQAEKAYASAFDRVFNAACPNDMGDVNSSTISSLGAVVLAILICLHRE